MKGYLFKDYNALSIYFPGERVVTISEENEFGEDENFFELLEGRFSKKSLEKMEEGARLMSSSDIPLAEYIGKGEIPRKLINKVLGWTRSKNLSRDEESKYGEQIRNRINDWLVR
ncbi:MAG TPA: hypothetical protein VMZ91_07745 [Candidatus Paceibacterota bacterium]|nr:hypothetical protein [Candidatus Paceibacterota bacterium]